MGNFQLLAARLRTQMPHSRLSFNQILPLEFNEFSGGSGFFDERKSTDRSALVYWLSEEVLSKNVGISVGRAERFKSPQSGRLERGGMRSKVQGTLGDCLYLEHLFQVEKRFSLEDSAILWLAVGSTGAYWPESVLERGWGGHVPEDGDGEPS